MQRALIGLLSVVVVAVVLVAFAPNQAEAHRHGYYGPRHYRPVPVYKYRPPRAHYYRGPYVAPPYRCNYGAPYYGGYYYGGPRIHIGIGF